jgi:hypothetical protein
MLFDDVDEVDEDGRVGIHDFRSKSACSAPSLSTVFQFRSVFGTNRAQE